MTKLPDRFRILHIVPYFNPAWAYGGPVRVAYELNKRLVERGHDVLIYTTDALDAERRSQAGEQLVDGVKVYRSRNLSNRLAWNRLFIPVGLGLGLPRLMNNFDVIHLHEFRTLQNVYALPGLRRYNLPYIVMPQGGLPPELRRTAIKHVYDALYGRALLERASRLHALTEMEHRQYLELGLPRERITIIPNGIDVTDFNFDVDVAAFKRKHNIPEGRPVIGFLARLSPIKGLDFLVDAFAELLKTYPDAILMICGPDDGAQASLEAQIARLGISHAVRFTGYIGGSEDKAAAYRASDVYVLPSRYEIQGITVMEALLNRVPSVTTDRCGSSFQLSQAGVIESVHFGNVAELAGTLTNMLTHREHARTQAYEGRDYVMRHFNWDTLVDQWIDVYRQCIAERRAAQGAG